ncbi:MAG: DNA-binding protein [Bacteroidota bacterium]|nr:DNA-binding protein [Bacteroidota bacterium]
MASEVKSYDKYPMILTPKDVQHILGLNDKQKDQVYNLFNTKSFPSEKVKGKYIIPKPRFLNWLGVTKEEKI